MLTYVVQHLSQQENTVVSLIISNLNKALITRIKTGNVPLRKWDYAQKWCSTWKQEKTVNISQVEHQDLHRMSSFQTAMSWWQIPLHGESKMPTRAVLPLHRKVQGTGRGQQQQTIYRIMSSTPWCQLTPAWNSSCPACRDSRGWHCARSQRQGQYRVFLLPPQAALLPWQHEQQIKSQTIWTLSRICHFHNFCFKKCLRIFSKFSHFLDPLLPVIL